MVQFVQLAKAEIVVKPDEATSVIAAATDAINFAVFLKAIPPFLINISIRA